MLLRRGGSTTQEDTMPQDDLNVNDPDGGKTDPASQAVRFGRVNNIIQRAISRYQLILTDLGAAGPSGDPTVQAALQQICASAAAAAGTVIPSSGAANPVDGIIVKVIKNPGPPSTPDVTNTMNLVQQIGQTLAAPTPGTSSSIEVKKEIHYLDEAARARIAEETMGLKLATYKYKTGDDRQHLGFILEDSPKVAAADMAQKQVDLYAYTSMVVATVQQQQHEIAELKAEIERLKK
jgi:hypothetical protein